MSIVSEFSARSQEAAKTRKWCVSLGDYHQPLAILQRRARVPLPNPRLGYHRGQYDFRAVEGSIQAAEEPLDPWRDVQAALLHHFQNAVIDRA